ncbi:hypothetical protein CPR19088_GLDEOEPO_02343 [Companilactobacillus paralimentarius]
MKSLNKFSTISEKNLDNCNGGSFKGFVQGFINGLTGKKH